MKQPYPFQDIAIELGSTTNTLLADQCGLGKTLVGVEVIKRLYAADEARNLPSLIVCPKPVRMQWTRTLHEQCPDLEHDMILVKETFNRQEYRSRQVAVVTHFEAMVRHHVEMAKILWSVIIVDEAHRISNRQADRTVAIRKIPSLFKLALTGTPVEKSPADMWSLLNWLYPDKFPGYWAFFNKYVMTEPGYNGHIKVRPGCADPAGLERELMPFTLRRTRQEVAPWLPPTITTQIPLNMTGKQAELYQLIDDATDVLIDMGEDDLLMVRNALAKIVKLQQVTSNPRLLGYTYYESPSCKEDWLTDWMKDHQDESVVIFCQFRDTVRWLARKFRIERVLGGFDNQKPKDLSKVNRLVATIAAAGEGVDLPHINTAIFYDVIWPARRMTQAIDRIQRLSSTEPKQIIYLTIPDTVDETVYFAVQNKWSFHKLIYTLIQRKRAKAQDTTSGQP